MRLIDADAFEVISFQGKTEEFAEGVKWILEQLDEQPTIQVGRDYVEKIGKCPMCTDCPDGCPLDKEYM